MTAAPTFPHLFSPFRVRGVELRNRIVSTAHGTTTSEAGLPTAATAAYHEARARGGAGLIVLEAAAVHESGVYNDRFLSCASDAASPGFRLVGEAVHRHGGTVFGQLYHPGATMKGRDAGGVRRVPISPSFAVSETSRVTAREMSRAMIDEIVGAFGKAATLMMAAGLDGIEINGRNGNLPAQFLNPRLNLRGDDYGGNDKGRLRFLMELVEEVRGRIGEGVPMGLRVSGEPMDETGLQPQEVIAACRALAPYVDYFNVVAGSIGTYAGLSHIVPPMGLANGYTAERAAVLKQATGRPVLVAGRITKPAQAEALLASGQADLCGMTRAMIADPQMPAKAKDGRDEEIRECLGCNQACIGHEPIGVPVSCIQYPETGRETTLPPRTRVGRARRVIVAGGGPAGLKAAAVAAERGHRVTLYERSPRFGGQAQLAALIPGRSEFGGIVPNLVRDAENAGADLVTGITVDPELLYREGADAVIVATGSRPYRAPFAGDDEIQVVDAGDVLTGAVRTGGSVVIADERCDWVGMGVAEKLVREGRHVRLCVMGESAGQELEAFTRYRWLGILHRLGVEVLSHLRLVGVSAGDVFFQHLASLEPVVCSAPETLVLAQSHRPSTGLEDEVRKLGMDYHVVGDCLLPRTAEEAVYEGMMAALSV